MRSLQRVVDRDDVLVQPVRSICRRRRPPAAGAGVTSFPVTRWPIDDATALELLGLCDGDMDLADVVRMH